jgi:2-polyprenyl-6-methoxyphenol hydroxylase-like FAD-dependent oxidoreductase
MSGRCIGEHAVVIGAGAAGLAAAGAVAPYYERVTVLERDTLAQDARPRAGAPQSAHIHVLLAGGLDALGKIYPGFSRDLEISGAVPLALGYDVRSESADHLPHEPRRNLGLHSYSLSRPLLEHCLRRRAHALPNVAIETKVHVERVIAHATEAGLQVSVRGKAARSADLVIDASGRGQPTLETIEALGLSALPTSVVGADLHYATAVFDLPGGIEGGWKVIMTPPGPKRPARGGLMAAIEGKQFMIGLGGASDDLAPSDPEGYLEWAKGLTTDTIHKAMASGRLARKVRRYNFTGSYRRHFDRVSGLPARLLPMGDALCRLNPVYGQGMSVAALEARTLGCLLEQVSTGSLGVHELTRAFFAQTDEIVESAWSMSAIPDLINPAAEGERPSDLKERLTFLWAVHQLARRDESVQRLATEVQSLLKPMSALKPLQEAARQLLAEQLPRS